MYGETSSNVNWLNYFEDLKIESNNIMELLQCIKLKWKPDNSESSASSFMLYSTKCYPKNTDTEILKSYITRFDFLKIKNNRIYRNYDIGMCTGILKLQFNTKIFSTLEEDITIHHPLFPNTGYKTLVLVALLTKAACPANATFIPLKYMCFTSEFNSIQFKLIAPDQILGPVFAYCDESCGKLNNLTLNNYKKYRFWIIDDHYISTTIVNNDYANSEYKHSSISKPKISNIFPIYWNNKICT